MRCWWFALLPGCGPPADSKPIEYGLRNQDWDGDGYDRPDDCNDADPEAFPGAVERCNGIDDDCDDLIDDDIAVPYYRDRDGDGYGATGTSFDICWHPDGYVEATGDCDDADPAISPTALEICDLYGIDEDCNGVANEDDPGVIDAHPAYVDADNDGYGVGAPDFVLCFATPGLSLTDGDCDDTTAERSPERIEVCDPGDVDEDCDGLADDFDPEGPWQATAWFVDADGDGFGDPSTGPAWFCDGVPPGWVDDALDCDDSDTTAYPNHYEDCQDGLDNDCDGVPDDCGPIPAINLSGADLAVAGDLDGLGDAVSWSDLDGDGSPELLLGAPTEYDGAGEVHVVPGRLRGEHDASDVETALLEGDGSFEYYGVPVVGLPDSDGDGMGGIAVGAMNAEGDEDIWLFDGPFTATVGQSSADAVIAIIGDSSGCWKAYAYGDSNGDGALDHVVGSTSCTSGRAHLVLGPVSGTIETFDGVLTADGETDAVGSSIAFVGDTDGDGSDDVAIGAQGYDSGDGAAFVVLGPDFVGADSDVATVASGVLKGVGDEGAGAAMTAGDVNGDGYGDLFVAAPRAGIAGALEVGRVYGVLGPIDEDAMSNPALRFQGEDRHDQFGISVAANGDVNGDGWDDLLVGAEYADHNPVTAGEVGAAYLFYGPMSGTLVATEARVRIDGELENSSAGSSVAVVPDVSVDGRADVLIGASRWSTAYLVTSEGL
jgi:hypothetical protein